MSDSQSTDNQAASAAPALEVRHLSKSFPGVRALSDVSLTVRPGSVHALVGENGAGKSTLVKVVAGIQAPDSGDVEIAGRKMTRFTPASARAMGVGLVAQEPEHFADLTALENFYVGDWERGPGPILDWSEMEQRARDVLADLDTRVPLDARMADLPLAQRQMIQIGRALLLDARLLILDEPTAALGQAETDALFALVRRLASRGVAIIYISHRLDEVFDLADEVTVLRDGEHVATRPSQGLTRDDLVRMMVGTHVPAARREAASPEADMAGREPVLETRNLCAKGEFEDVSLSVRPGEILGLAGLQGSGRNALAHALGGALRTGSGQVLIDGRARRLKSPRAATDAGVVLAPGDRPGQALVLPMTLRENITLSVLDEVSRGPFPRLDREREVARRYSAELDVRASSLEQVTATLSGGNQQKVSLARRLAAEPRVLVLEEPTQGVDVGARAEIHRLLRELAADGLAIIMVSSDMDEILALSDRVAVMHRGRVAEVLDGDKATKERILELAFGEGVTTEHEGGTAPAPSLWRRLLGRRELILGLVVLIASLVLGLTTDTFGTAGNFRDMAVNSSYVLIAALGMTMIILTAGIDISIGSMLALCCMAFGVMAREKVPIPWVVVGTLSAGALLGGINAVGVGLMRLPPIIMTLATLTIFRGAVLRLGGGDWIQLPEEYLFLGRHVILGLPIPVWVAGIAIAAVALVLRYTAFGRSLYALGNNVEASEHLGISLRRHQLLVYTIGGLLVGLAALAYAPRFDVVQTNSGLGLEMLVITAVVVGGTDIFGGRGSVLGTVLGVILLTLISNALNLTQVSDYWEKAFHGVLVLVAVVADHVGRRSGGRGGEGT